nr:nucleotidyltransferase family protein [Pleionea sp. CnH1-48]
MILAAGFGKRMLPLTEHTPKPLLKVGKQSLIEHHLDGLATAGVKDVVINTAHLAEQIEQTLGNGQRYGLNIEYSREPYPLETAGAIIQALPLLGSQEFILVNGDVFTDFDFSTLMSKNTQYAHLIVVPNPEQHPEGDFALRDGVLNSTDLPKYTYAGLGLYHPQMFANYEAGSVLPLGPILRQQMLQQHISGQLYEGVWHDIGTPQRLEQLNQQILQETHGS